MTLSQQQQAEIAALVAAQARAYDKLEQRTVDTVERLLRQIYDLWFTPGAVRPIARDLADTVRAAQENVADLVEGYQDQIFDAMGIEVPRSKRNAHVKLPKRLRGIDALIEWERPARDARVVRLLGAEELEANEKARLRAERQAKMDLMLARREAERQRFGLSDDIIGFRRILHPELSKSGPCGLCVVAADRIYRKSELKPLHNECVCDSLPVTRVDDPGINLNRDDLNRIYEAAGGTGRQGLQRVRVQVLEHGELGPILVDNKYKNRNASQAKSIAEKGLDPQRVFDVQSRILRKLERDIAAGKTVNEKTLAFHQNLVREYAKKLGIELDAA